MALEKLPLKPPDDPPPERIPAPAWLALLSPWLGLITLALSILTFIVPGSRDPRAELSHAQPYSAADLMVPIALYMAAIAVFIPLVIFWQMRTQPRPLLAPLAAQRLQAIVGMSLAIIGIAIVYFGVAQHPGAIVALAFAAISVVVVSIGVKWSSK
jgi:hypothetical protein